MVRGFWQAVGPDYQPPLPASTVAAAIARAGGNVLHAVMLHASSTCDGWPASTANVQARGHRAAM